MPPWKVGVGLIDISIRLHKSRQSRVYHQDEVLYIINSKGIVCHHCESNIQPAVDEIHASRDDMRLSAMICHCFRNE